MVVYAIQRQPLEADMEGPWHTVVTVPTFESARRMVEYMYEKYPEYHWSWSTVRIGV